MKFKSKISLTEPSAKKLGINMQSEYEILLLSKETDKTIDNKRYFIASFPELGIQEAEIQINEIEFLHEAIIVRGWLATKDYLCQIRLSLCAM